MVKVAPACNIVIIQVVEPAAVLLVLCMVLCLVVIETMIALPYLDIGFETGKLRIRQSIGLKVGCRFRSERNPI